MPELDDISYSFDECVSAVRDYYAFLTKMYMDESEVLEPPEQGWPSIINAKPDTLEEFGKNSEVLRLLAHLPYVCDPTNIEEVQTLPNGRFTDWQKLFAWADDGSADIKGLKSTTEGDFYDFNIPYAIGLSHVDRFYTTLILDTQLGVIHYGACPGEIRYTPSQEPILDDFYDYADEEDKPAWREAEWRADAPAWTVPAFFELLKDQFRQLNFIPLGRRTVIDVFTNPRPGQGDLIPMVQDIYRQHGWPNLSRYNKDDCIRAVQKALRERYPNETYD